MQLGKRNRLMLLFLSPQNPIWKKLLGPDPRPGAVVTMAGTKLQNISHWKKGDAIAPASSEHIFNATLGSIAGSAIGDADKRALIDKVTEFREAYYDRKEMDAAQAAGLLGYTTLDYRRLIDQILSEHKPLLEHAYYPNREEAEDTLKAFGGLYVATMTRGDTSYHCPIHVRYVLEIGNGYTIRCKLMIPSDRDQPSWEYDGFMTVRDHSIFWVFDRRGERPFDMIFLITELLYWNTTQPLSGKYVTTSQAENQPVIAGEVDIQRVHQLNDPVDADEFMAHRCARE